MEKMISTCKNHAMSSFIEIPSTKQYWMEITQKLAEELKKYGVILFDCYLVGSGMNIELLADLEDIDSAIIIKNNYSDKEMLIIRDKLDSLIMKIDTFSKYHFRMFDEAGFKDFAVYDGYRLFEFQCDNLSFCDTDILFQKKPVLNLDNFYVSYLIQLVYDCLMNREIFEFKIASKKAENRYERNLIINSTSGISFELNENCYLLKDFFAIRNNSSQSISEWQKFLSKYYLRIKHEYINKFSRYQLNLRDYLCQI